MMLFKDTPAVFDGCCSYNNPKPLPYQLIMLPASSHKPGPIVDESVIFFI